MRKIVDLLKLFILQCKIKIARGMQYRTDFFLGIFVSMVLSGMGPLIQYLIFTRTNGYHGWNLNQIILFQGVLLFWYGLKDTLFGGVRLFVEGLVKKGEFDRLLLRPYPPMGVILSSGFHYYGFGSVAAGIVVICYALSRLNLSLSIASFGYFALFMLCGLVFYMAVTVLYCTVVVMIIYMHRISEILDKLLRFSDYPSDIFPIITKTVIITFVPLALWAYFPSQALLHRLDAKAFIACLSSFLVFIISIKIWNVSLKKYSSAGG